MKAERLRDALAIATARLKEFTLWPPRLPSSGRVALQGKSEAKVLKFKYLRRDVDQGGNLRTYLRVPGRPLVRLRSPVGSPEFAEEYAAALSAADAAARKASNMNGEQAMKAEGLRDALAMARQDAEQYRERDDAMGAAARMVDLRCKTAELLVAEHLRGTAGHVVLQAMCLETACCLAQAISVVTRPELRAEATTEVLSAFVGSVIAVLAAADGVVAFDMPPSPPREKPPH